MVIAVDIQQQRKLRQSTEITSRGMREEVIESLKKPQPTYKRRSGKQKYVAKYKFLREDNWNWVSCLFFRK